MRLRNFISRLLVTAMFPCAAALTSASEPSYSYFGNDGDQQGLVRATTPIHRVGFEDNGKGGATSDLLKKPCGVGCGCCPSHTFIAGAEATLLWSDLKGTRAATQSFFGEDHSTNLSDPDGMFAAPRVWLGWQGERWGVVGRYWDLRGDARHSEIDSFTALNNPFDARILSESDLRAYNTDLELTRAFALGNWAATGSGGVRYALLEDRSDISRIGMNVADPDDPQISSVSAAASRSRFSGTGLTAGLLAHRPLWADSNWSLFWNTRASLLWGSHRASAESLTMLDALGFSGSDLDFDDDRDSGADMFIGEIQVGVQWEQQLRYLPGSAFFRIAGEYQYWDVNSDATARSDADVTLFGGFGPTVVAASADAGSSRLHLYGLTLGTGFLW